MNTADTMVVVADGSRARFFTTDAEMVDLLELPEMHNKQHTSHRHKAMGSGDSGHHS